MSDSRSQVLDGRKVTYIGKDPTLIRAYRNGPKIEVVNGQTIVVDESQARFLGGIPTLWEVEGMRPKFDKQEEARLQEHKQDMKDLEAAKDAPAEVPADAPKADEVQE
jgi:hypothetical protein